MALFHAISNRFSDYVAVQFCFPAILPGAQFLEASPCLAGACQGGAAKKAAGAKRLSELPDNLDKQRPDIQWNEGARAGNWLSLSATATGNARMNAMLGESARSGGNSRRVSTDCHRRSRNTGRLNC